MSWINKDDDDDDDDDDEQTIFYASQQKLHEKSARVSPCASFLSLQVLIAQFGYSHSSFSVAETTRFTSAPFLLI